MVKELGWDETWKEKRRQGSSCTMMLLRQHYHVQTGSAELVPAEMSVCSKFELATGIKQIFQKYSISKQHIKVVLLQEKGMASNGVFYQDEVLDYSNFVNFQVFQLRKILLFYYGYEADDFWKKQIRNLQVMSKLLFLREMDNNHIHKKKKVILPFPA